MSEPKKETPAAPPPTAPTPLPEGRGEIMRDWLNSRIVQIEECADKDVLTILGELGDGLEVHVRLVLERMGKSRRKVLLVLLDTPGGSLEAARAIAQTFRHFYPAVHFLVPVRAMSAGTVLVMSGDAIYMDYFSRLGPIDPQVKRGGFICPGVVVSSPIRSHEAKSKGRRIDERRCDLAGQVGFGGVGQH